MAENSIYVLIMEYARVEFIIIYIRPYYYKNMLKYRYRYKCDLINFADFSNSIVKKRDSRLTNNAAFCKI